MVGFAYENLTMSLNSSIPFGVCWPGYLAPGPVLSLAGWILDNWIVEIGPGAGVRALVRYR